VIEKKEVLLPTHFFDKKMHQKHVGLSTIALKKQGDI